MLFFEILGGLAVVGFLSMFGFIVLPSLIGCVGFILFLMIFLSLMLVVSVSLGWFILIAMIAYLVVALGKFIRYYKLPDYASYVSSNGYSRATLACKNCGSTQLIHAGILGNRSKLRYYLCMSCRKALYKFKVLE